MELAGRYLLEEMLGHGSVGEVWRATDRALHRLVAVKVIRDRIDDPELAAGFGREARIAGGLQHPGITVVHDIGEHDGRAFIVMELLHGRDLETVLKDTPGGLPIGTVVALGIQAADALRAAHAGSVIHRDLKPANLFLGNDGLLKICDFGIAVAAGAAGSVIESSYIVGTATYMSPEQCDGEQLDGRSDLYSLGCVLYALLTGRPPFPAGNVLQVMAQHRKTAPGNPRLPRPETPADLEQIVLRLLAKNPADRPADAAQLAAELRALQGPNPIQGPQPIQGRQITASTPATPSRLAASAVELRDLLEGPRGYRDLLGLLAAARGGLTLADLEELTEQAEMASFEIQAVLRDGAGRIFATGTADWRAEQTFRLADETVRAETAAALGVGLLAAYRERLHEWARRYKEQDWPAATPGYLLTGYTRTLRDGGETARLVECATDRVRHDRMFVLSGGDSAALSEISAAQEAVLSQEDPDLSAMVLLAAHRADLVERDTVIPVDLPAVWVALNRQDRAENLARSITAPDRRARALAAIAAANRGPGVVAADVAAAGHYDPAEDAARSIADPILRAQALTAVAKAMAAAGLPERGASAAMAAEAAIRSVVSPGGDHATTDLAIAMAAAGLDQQARQLVRSIIEPEARALASAGIVHATGSRSRNAPLAPAGIADLAQAGLRDQAEIAAIAAAKAAMRHPRQWQELADVAFTLAIVGLRDESIRVFTAARRAANLVTWGDMPHPRQALGGVISVLAKAGPGLRDAATPAADDGRPPARPGSQKMAKRIARKAIQSASERQDDPALAQVAWQLASAGFSDQAEEVASRISQPDPRDQALADIALALSISGRHERAEKLARALSASHLRDQAFADIAQAMSVDGRHEQAEKLASSVSQSRLQARALAGVALTISADRLLSADRRYDQAVKLARSIAQPEARARALGGIAEAMTEAGREDQARHTADTALTAGGSIADPAERVEALASLAATLTAAGLTDLAAHAAVSAETTARAITIPGQRTRALITAASALAGLREPADAARYPKRARYLIALALA